jgi:hypothetical protein
MSNKLRTQNAWANYLHYYAVFQGSCCLAVIILTTLGLTMQTGTNLDRLSASASALSCLGFIVGDIVAYKVLGKVFARTLEQKGDKQNRILGTILFEITVLFGMVACISRAFRRPDYVSYGMYWAFTTAAFATAIFALALKVLYAQSLVRRLQHLALCAKTKINDTGRSNQLPLKEQPKQQTSEGQLYAFQVYLFATMAIYMGNAAMFFVLPIWSCYFASFTAMFYYWALRRCALVGISQIKVPVV